MKFLILRFSSIGDIVLTTPVIRALANDSNKNKVHFLTKNRFKDTLIHNPYLDKLFTFEKEITEVVKDLKAENYDYIIDLHSNIRSKRLIANLRKKSLTFNKLNYEKWIRVNLKKDILPQVHIVERYMDTLSFLNIKYDEKGLDYFVSENDEKAVKELALEGIYNVFVVGGAHNTKQIPNNMLIELGKSSKQPIVLLGGKDDVKNAKAIEKEVGDKVTNLVGKLNLNESAAVIKYCKKVVTPDTGLMHIAAAMKREILSVWGNTIPEFGMWSLLPKELVSKNHIFEVKNLSCRPCSKIGYDKCPKSHFNCMVEQDVEAIVEVLNN
jgi:ADP-heptose:LPS heptosyltransferase